MSVEEVSAPIDTSLSNPVESPTDPADESAAESSEPTDTTAETSNSSPEDTVEHKQVSRERQIQEVTFTGSILAFNEIMKIDTEGTYDKDSAQYALRGAKAMLEYPEGSYTDVDEQFRKLDRGNPILITLDNDQYQVMRIDSGTESDFTCLVKNTQTGATESRTIPRNHLALAHMVSEKDKIKTLFPAEDHSVLDAYFEIVENGSESFTPDENTDSIIKSTAERNGVVTSEKVKEFINESSLPEEKKQQLAAVLEGANILDYALLEQMLGEEGLEGNFETKLNELREKFPGNEQAEKIFSALKEGNLHEVLLAIRMDLRISENDSPGEVARKKAALEKSSSLLKDGGTIMLYLLFYLGMSTIETGMKR